MEGFTTKKEIRTAMKLRNRAITPDQRLRASETIFGRIEQTELFERADCIAFFNALSDEPDTSVALTRWHLAGKRVVLPRVEGDRMRFFEYHPTLLSQGAFGIWEPSEAASECAPSQIELMVVPGVAFSAKGARMGRGKGFYDRYLSQPEFRGVTIGVCYAHQIIATLPIEPHDVAMDIVVCEGEVLR